MDSLVNAAARALRAGDPLGALKRIALREDAEALALRGIAMAQLGDLGKAKLLLRRAARGFGPREAMARARCATAEAEVALAARDLGWPTRALAAAVRTFEARGDRDNAVHARLLQVRRLLLLGQVGAAETALAGLDLVSASAMLVAIAQLLTFEIAVRRADTGRARAALERAHAAAAQARIPVLIAEVAQAGRALTVPAARLKSEGAERSILLDEVEAVLRGGHLVIDGCRRLAQLRGQVVLLARRPVLFALLRTLAEAWPGEVARDDLIAQVFGARRVDGSHRVRLRVEIGRLRREMRDLAEVRATAAGFTLGVQASGNPGQVDDLCAVRVLAPPIEGEDAAVLALLADGEAWSTSALALALAASQRTAQRALVGLEGAGKVRALGQGRARRWLAPPISGFTTTLLLPETSVAG
jgi:hypothetical protein